MSVKITAMGDNCIDSYDNIGQKYVGGNPVNVAVYIKRMGGESEYIGVVGNDDNGVLVKNRLKEKGVCIERVKTLDGETAVTHINLIDSERVFSDEYEEGVLPQFTLTETDILEAAKSNIVVSGIWGYAERFFPALSRAGACIAMDFSTELQSKCLEEYGQYIDYAFFSYEKGTEKLETFLQNTFSKVKGIVIVTLGQEGSAVYDGNDIYRYGIEPCEVVDTMGAGDSYIAGFLYGAAMGEPIIDCMKRGTENSTITIGYHGAW